MFEYAIRTILLSRWIDTPSFKGRDIKDALSHPAGSLNRHMSHCDSWLIVPSAKKWPNQVRWERRFIREKSTRSRGVIVLKPAWSVSHYSTILEIRRSCRGSLSSPCQFKDPQKDRIKTS